MQILIRSYPRLVTTKGRPTTNAEIKQRLALPVHKVELLLRCSRDVNSIDENVYQNKGKMSSGNEVQVKDRIASESVEPQAINERNALRTELRRAMQILSEREAQIVEMRFGLADGSPMTLEEIGRHFSVTRERIRQIEARALSKMRNPAKTNEIKEIFQDHAEMGAQIALALEKQISPSPAPEDFNVAKHLHGVGVGVVARNTANRKVIKEEAVNMISISQ